MAKARSCIATWTEEVAGLTTEVEDLRQSDQTAQLTTNRQALEAELPELEDNVANAREAISDPKMEGSYRFLAANADGAWAIVRDVNWEVGAYPQDYYITKCALHDSRQTFAGLEDPRMRRQMTSLSIVTGYAPDERTLVPVGARRVLARARRRPELPALRR